MTSAREAMNFPSPLVMPEQGSPVVRSCPHEIQAYLGPAAVLSYERCLHSMDEEVDTTSTEGRR
jgi:hypothetical protein